MKKSFLSIVGVGLVVAACSSASDTDPTVQDANVTTVNVGGTAGNQFSPAEVTVKVGSKVRWNFAAGGSHNVVSGADCANPQPATFSSGEPGAVTTFEHLFETAGDFFYQCTLHCSMNMKGVVHVTP